MPRSYNIQEVITDDTIKAKERALDLNASKDELSFYIPFSQAVLFRGQEYPNNFQFISEYETAEDIPVGTIVGQAIASWMLMGDRYADTKNRKLVWDGKGVVAKG